MTEFVDVPGGRIAYDLAGAGPLVVLSHGIGVRRQDYRFLAPVLAQAGYRVATADLRGYGESSMGWASITRTDVAGDLAALIGQLGGPAVLVAVRQSRGGRPSTQAPARDERGRDASQGERLTQHGRAREFRASAQGQQMRLSQSLRHSTDLLSASADPSRPARGRAGERAMGYSRGNCARRGECMAQGRAGEEAPQGDRRRGGGPGRHG